MNYTKGEWKVGKQAQFALGLWIEDSEGHGIAVVDISDKANAHLIAAAPEMYEALESLRDFWLSHRSILKALHSGNTKDIPSAKEISETENTALANAIKALAKAEGK